MGDGRTRRSELSDHARRRQSGQRSDTNCRCLYQLIVDGREDLDFARQVVHLLPTLNPLTSIHHTQARLWHLLHMPPRTLRRMQYGVQRVRPVRQPGTSVVVMRSNRRRQYRIRRKLDAALLASSNGTVHTVMYAHERLLPLASVSVIILTCSPCPHPSAPGRPDAAKYAAAAGRRRFFLRECSDMHGSGSRKLLGAHTRQPATTGPSRESCPHRSSRRSSRAYGH